MNNEEINQLNEQLDEIINEDVINEMSQAFGDKKYQVNAWVENENTRPGSDRYFKYSDNSSFNRATKCCRINLDEPTVQYHRNRDGKMDWVLSEKDKRNLVKLLNSTYSKIYNMTYWQQILYTFNSDRFQMTIDEFLEDEWSSEEYPEAYRKDYPMPDYLNLKFDLKKCKNKIAQK